MNYLRRYIHICASLALILPACALAQPGPSPRLPTPISWSGTRELALGSHDDALAAVRKDTAVGADSLLRRFKIGTINVFRGKYADAVPALNRVDKGCPVLAPLAMEQVGDAAMASSSNAEGMTLAIAAYGSALKAAGLPKKYREHLFAKIRAASKDAPLPANQPWLAEYAKWHSKQRLFDAAGLEAVADSLIKAGLIVEADSILELHLPEISKRDACGIIKRIFEQRSGDSSTMATKFLFTLASQANGCGDLKIAERMLAPAQKRPDFSAAVPERKALLLEAQLAFNNSQWQKAIGLYKKYDAGHGPESDVLMNIARAYRSLDNIEQAAAWYDRHIKHFPSHAKSQEILWLRAWQHEEKGHFKSAASAYRRVFNTKGKRTEEAHIRNALCYYKQKEYDSALVHLNAFQKKYPQSSYLWAGMFWQGKCHTAMKRTTEAHKVWGNLAKLEPTDYYAHRARQLMGEPDSAKLIFTSTMAVDTPEAVARVWLDSISPAPKKTLTAKDSLNLRRGAALLSVGLADIADLFLDEYERNYHNNLQLQYDLANAYAIAGNEALAFRVARRLSWRIPMEHRGMIPVQVQSVLYPSFYSKTISKHAEEFKVDPLFVIAVMRQESIFDKNIVSPAGAVGLMQIMPATGKMIAGELKEKFAEDSLYSYAYNIRFGTFYLRKRLDQFKGDREYALALCSYNAGPNNAIKWRDRSKGAEYDIFVEDIGFFETRGYVKKVMGNYWTYKGLVNIPGYKYESGGPKEEEYLWFGE